jgi:hypothetical protein
MVDPFIAAGQDVGADSVIIPICLAVGQQKLTQSSIYVRRIWLLGSQARIKVDF